VREIDISADDIVRSLLGQAADRGVCILDSCGVGHKGSHLLIAGIDPIEQTSFQDPELALAALDSAVGSDVASIFTLSYDLGCELLDVKTRHRQTPEPGLYQTRFRTLVVHDYETGRSVLVGNDDLPEGLFDPSGQLDGCRPVPACDPDSNFSRNEYLHAVDVIKEEIRSGNTYQTNLTRQINVGVSDPPANVFTRLRNDHPAPFSTFIQRPDSTVISASPERFFRIDNGTISASPIKGTRPRGSTPAEDSQLRFELLSSEKDRAENTMIVDLLRNDLGRVCEFGSVEVECLCEIEELPSLFHMVSTIGGRLNQDAKFSDILRALFPCGSITGAPKISTIKIIDEIEPTARGLSMGAIGCYIPESFGIGESIDISVAIRTMVIRDGIATFNVGGGIVIDSDPEREWDETVVKSRALLNSLGIEV
jgi:aminodeoxychorismate synthase component I